MKHCPRCQQTYSDTQRFCLSDGELLSLRDPYHLLGRTLTGKYRLDALIGIGGMGAVYSAHHLDIDRHIAIKILQPNVALGNSQIITLFEREAKIAGRLFHENIVNIFDAGRTDDDIAYIAMEWLDGCTLQDELAAQGALSFERVAEILRQVADALEEAHARHIIHRDLKPSNVMLIKRKDGRERIKVLDFGISKVLSATAGSPVSLVMGTPHYASPEQLQIGANIDGRSDIYSLGVMLYEMLTGAIPFNASSAHELIRMQMTATPPPLRQLRPDAPVALEQLVNRLLAKEPDERPQHVGEIPALFEQALGRFDQRQAETLIDVETTQVETKAVEAMPSTLPNPNSSPPAPDEVAPRGFFPLSARLRWAIGIAIGAVVLSIILVAYWGWKPKSTVRVEVLNYYLEVSTAEGPSSLTTGRDPLRPNEVFNFHFLPQAGGYLYIVSEKAGKAARTWLTTQPETKLLAAGSNFEFPGGKDGIELESGDTVVFTIIFSPVRLEKPAFLTELAKELTAAEQQEFKAFREQFKTDAEMTGKSDHGQPMVTVSVPAGRGGNETVIFEIPIKQQ